MILMASAAVGPSILAVSRTGLALSRSSGRRRRCSGLSSHPSSLYSSQNSRGQLAIDAGVRSRESFCRETLPS